MSSIGFPRSTGPAGSQRDTERFCANCQHHGSFHQLITRDKWEDYGLELGKIPWFCEYEEENPKTGEKTLCSCTDFQPKAAGVT